MEQIGAREEIIQLHSVTGYPDLLFTLLCAHGSLTHMDCINQVPCLLASACVWHQLDIGRRAESEVGVFIPQTLS